MEKFGTFPSELDFEKVAKWLENEATDEQMAEFFVYWMELRKKGDEAYITAETMKSFNVDEFIEWLSQTLQEILYSKDICTFAWWKQKDEGEYRIYSKQTDKRTGKCIGTMVSVNTYASIEEAKKDAGEFEIETDTFKQEVVAISTSNPFKGGECDE